MTYIWNIYEPCDPINYDPEDPYDIFVYSLRKEDAPQPNAPMYIEGRRCRIVAIKPDTGMNSVNVSTDEKYYKVCVTSA
mgnify:CR=1 FL=1